jgi:hypothetical protein
MVNAKRMIRIEVGCIIWEVDGSSWPIRAIVGIMPNLIQVGRIILEVRGCSKLWVHGKY